MTFKKQIPWNKGLTVETDERVAKYVNKQRGQKRPSITGNKNPAKRKDVRKKLIKNNAMKNKENRIKISIANKENWKNPIIRKRRIDAMKGIPKTDKAKLNMSNARKKLLIENPDVLKNSLIYFKGKKTNIEKIIENILIKNNIKYKYDFKILRYCVDFVINNSNLIIECDGEYWHNKRKKQDKIRQSNIEKEGWKFIRFTGTQIIKNLIECEKIILNNVNR